MTAPKIKMLAHNGGLPSGNYPATDLVRYIRADAPELVALVAAVKAEIEARNRFLSTAPDRGGSHGPKGQRKMALENAQLATTFALAAYEALK